MLHNRCEVAYSPPESPPGGCEKRERTKAPVVCMRMIAFSCFSLSFSCCTL